MAEPSKAEQRQLAVEKLRRAASLPRMKDGRRPPMHVEAVSEGEKPSPDIPDEKKSPSQSPPLEDISPPQEPANEPEPEPEQEQEHESADPEPDQDVEERTVSPSPAGRSKRRSRSRSRSRGSRDFKNKARNAQSPVPPTGDSSPEDEPDLPPIAIPVVTPLLSPIPHHLSPFQHPRFLRSPTPDPSMLYPNFPPPTPIPLPTLEALQRGLIRSNSANSPAAGRRQALAKLTGGADIYDPSPSTSPTPPPFTSGGGLSRNNTVAGGERFAARQLMLNRLNGRIAKEAEAEASGSEERGAPSPTPKKRRRRSRGNSMRALNAAAGGVSDSDNNIMSTDTPVPPHPFHPRPPDQLAELRAQSTTPMQTSSSRGASEAEMPPGVMPAADNVSHGTPVHARRRSIVVEEEIDDENVREVDGEAEEEEEEPEEEPPQQHQLRYPGLPATPPRITPHVTLTRAPHSSDLPFFGSLESGAASDTVGVPVFISQRTPSRNDVFPVSPFNSPLKERPTEEEEEQVLYYPDHVRGTTPFSDIHTDGHGREISWIGDPVPIMVEDESDEDGDDDEAEKVEDDDMPPPPTTEDEDDAFEEPLSPTSSDAPQKDGSFSPQPSSQSVVVESERSPEMPAQTSSTPSSGAHVSTSQSIDESRVSPQLFPTRLSIASRTLGGSDKSPLPGDEWEDQSTSTKRNGNGDHTSPSTWDKLKGAFSRAGSGRRSRSNSIAARERRDNVESSVSRESGASLTIAKNDKLGEGPGQQQQPLQAPPLMQTPSASASILSLSPHPHVPTRGGASPIPPMSGADLMKYQQDKKLFPFPGIQKLEEQRNRVRAAGVASHSSPDVSTVIVDEDQQAPSFAHTNHNTPAPTPEPLRERKLSHQASDSRLITKPNGVGNSGPSSSSLIMTSSNSQGEYIDVAPSPPSSHNGKVSKLPMTLPGVKQWLHNKKIFTSSPSHPQPPQPPQSPPPAATLDSANRDKNGNKKPSLSDLLRKRASDADWEEVGTTPISVDGGFSFLSSSSHPSTPGTTATIIPPKIAPSSSSSDSNEKMPVNDRTTKPTSHTDTEKTPKAKKVAPLDLQKSAYPHIDEYPSPFSNMPSRSDPLLSSTPDPTSSLSDYPPRSTSQSSSESSQYSLAPQGSLVLDRIDENLVRGSKNPPFLTSVLDDPPRKSVFTWPVYQVVNQKTVKDRFLFLFNDLLVIAKPQLSPHENLVEFKASSLDRQFVVKNVVLLKDIRFTPGRTDPTPRSPSQKDQQPARSSAIRGFVTQFTIEPETAVRALLTKNPVLENPRKLGQFIFQTGELDRAKVGEFLAKKMHKQELDAYLNCYGFVGVRVDKALRAFLMSVNVPVHNSSALDNLLDAFAGRWYDANARFVAFDKNMASRLARALVRLNMFLHGDLAEMPGTTGYPLEDFPIRDWVEHLRRADPRQLLSTDLMEELYDSIRQEKLCQALAAGAPSPLTITIRKPVPSRLTYKYQSDPIILRIPGPDPHLTIHLEGQDLLFDPPVLNFVKSSEASFRIIGNELGLKTMIMCRSGPNALKYTGLPLSNTLVVERAFMRNTFQIAFTDHREMKRRYMFSVADPVWALNVRTSIEQATSSAGSTPSASTEASKFLRVAENVAFNVLQRTLIDGLDFMNSNSPSAENGHVSSLKPHMNGKSHAFRSTKHVRSKSRSQLYRLDAGQNELDLSYESSSCNEFRDSELSDVNDEESEEPIGPVWSGEDVVSLCQQNSTIPLVLSLLQVGVLGKEAVNSSS